MAKLIYMAITPLDGYIEDEEGRFDWAVPDAEAHAFVNDLGGAKSGLPRDIRIDLELLDERQFANGVVHMHHRAR